MIVQINWLNELKGCKIPLQLSRLLYSSCYTTFHPSEMSLVPLKLRIFTSQGATAKRRSPDLSCSSLFFVVRRRGLYVDLGLLSYSWQQISALESDLQGIIVN